MQLLPRESEHGWTPYIWLIYLGLYVAFPFATDRPAVLGNPVLSWAAWAAGLAAFLALYFRGYWVDGARRLPIIVLLSLLGAILGPINPGALMFFVYSAAFVGGAVRPSHAGFWIGGITVVGVLVAALTIWHPIFIAGVALMSPIIGFVNLHYVETRRRDASLRLAQEEIARLATLAERERIAGDLHDLLGQTLSVIVLKSELAAKLVARDPERAAAEIGEVERVSREALTEVRRAVHGFRSATIADELVRARAVLGTAHIVVEADASIVTNNSAIDGLPREVEHAAAMVLREAVTNVVRHARATWCRISASRSEDHLVLQIEDDGRGGPVVEGAGIGSMRARTREIGGTLEHRRGRGLTVTLRAPWGGVR